MFITALTFLCAILFLIFLYAVGRSIASLFIVLPRLEPVAFLPKSIAVARLSPGPACTRLLRLFLGPVVLYPCRLGPTLLT